MSKTITISGTDYQLPQQGENPPWGKDLADLIEAMCDVLNSLSGTGDILTTNFTVANNQSAAANVNGLTFDVGTIRSAIVTYSVYRSTSLSEKGETGFLLLTYLTTANAWTVARYTNSDAGMIFSVTDTGQVQFTSDNMSGTSYVGKMKFQAKAFPQV